MPSNDARTLLHTALPTAATGVVATVVAAVLVGGKGALGAVIGTLLVIAFMGMGLVVLQRTAKSLPHLFQAMGLMLYMTQLLLLFMVMAFLKGTSAFDFKAFAFTLLAATIAWVAAQARYFMKAKIMYVEPGSSAATGPQKTGSTP
jgi:ATP synthase protein I